MKVILSTAILAALSALPSVIHGHGYMETPMARYVHLDLSQMLVVALVNIDVSNLVTHLLSFSPHSNLYANREGRSGNPANAPAIPLYQTTPQGVNRNNNVCGMDQGWPNNDYDAWLDTQGNPMPWISQAIYNPGDIIQVDSYLTAHHKGKKKEKKIVYILSATY